jgi:Uma2 family endonuclease
MVTNSIHFDNFDARLEMPMNLNSLHAFRAWITSDEAADSAVRIDYINGRIEADMSPEDLFTHGTLKIRLIAALDSIIHAGKLGHLFSDSTRVSCPSANLSVEPDLVFVSHESLAADRVRLVPKTSFPDRYVEVEGPPELIVEIVSDSSVKKDTKSLPKAYFAAGVPEYWLVDARREELLFQINHRGTAAFEATPIDGEGFQFSEVLQRRFKLMREKIERGNWHYELLVEPI